MSGILVPVRRVTVTFTVSLWVKDNGSSMEQEIRDSLAETIDRAGEGIVNAFVDFAPMVAAAKDEQEIFGVEDAIGIGGHGAIEVEEDGQ